MRPAGIAPFDFYPKALRELVDGGDEVVGRELRLLLRASTTSKGVRSPKTAYRSAGLWTPCSPPTSKSSSGKPLRGSRRW